MNALKKNLKQREQSELLAIIERMLRQEPELAWLLHTPLPNASSRRTSIDPKLFQQQVVAAMSANDDRRKRKRGEVQRRLTAIKSIADEFAATKTTNAAAIYEVVAVRTLSHYLSYHDEDGALGRVIRDCVESLGACLESEREDGALRLSSCM